MQENGRTPFVLHQSDALDGPTSFWALRRNHNFSIAIYTVQFLQQFSNCHDNSLRQISVPASITKVISDQYLGGVISEWSGKATEGRAGN